jgi:hypothetical protein
VLFFFIAVVLPVGQLLLGSFFRFFGFYTWDMLTLENYTKVFQNGELQRAVWNTLRLGLLRGLRGLRRERSPCDSRARPRHGTAAGRARVRGRRRRAASARRTDRARDPAPVLSGVHGSARLADRVRR